MALYQGSWMLQIFWQKYLMGKHYLQFLIYFFLLQTAAFGQIINQDIYEVKFNLKDNLNDQYTALVILNSDGSSEVRINYFNTKSNRHTIYTTPFLRHQNDLGEKQLIGLPPTIISGNDRSKCHWVFFDFFKYDIFQKTAEAFLDVNFKIVSAPISAVTNLRREDLSQKYIQQFYKTDEQFYTALFKPMDRSKKIQSTPVFYSLIVANTAEIKIGPGCQFDVSQLISMLSKITADLKIKWEKVSISRDNFNKQNVLSAISNIKVKKQDIVFFYYTGHGFSYKGDSTHIYPQLDLRSNPAVYSREVIDASTKNLAEVYEMLKMKGAKVNLVIGDCCNSMIEFNRYFPSDKQAKFNFDDTSINRKAAASLFFTKQSVLVGAAKKGEYAVTDEAIGSLFTSGLINSLYQTLYLDADKVITWNDILKNLSASTTAKSKGYDCGEKTVLVCLQEPIYEIEKK